MNTSDHKKYCELAQQGKTFWHPEVAQKLICEECIHHNQPEGIDSKRHEYTHPKHSLTGKSAKAALATGAGVVVGSTIVLKPSEDEIQLDTETADEPSADFSIEDVEKDVLAHPAKDENSTRPAVLATAAAGVVAAGSLHKTKGSVEHAADSHKHRIQINQTHTQASIPVGHGTADSTNITSTAKVAEDPVADSVKTVATAKSSAFSLHIAKALPLLAGLIVVAGLIGLGLNKLNDQDSSSVAIAETTPTPTETEATPTQAEAAPSEAAEPTEAEPTLTPEPTQTPTTPSGSYQDADGRFSFSLPTGNTIAGVTNQVKTEILAVESANITRDVNGNITTGYELFVSEISNVAPDTTLLNWAFPSDIIQSISETEARYISISEFPPCIHHIERLSDGTVLEFWLEKADINSDEYVDVLDQAVDSLQEL